MVKSYLLPSLTLWILDAKERFDCLKEIERYIKESKISETQYRRMWKAMFYGNFSSLIQSDSKGLWAADKMKVQMEVAMTIAKMVHLFENESMLTWMSAGFEIFHREWDKLDYWRTSKFLSLARFCLNEVYLYLEKKNYNGKVRINENNNLKYSLACEAME